MRKNRLIVTLSAIIFSLTMSAQNFHFDEVTYSPQSTVFKLFAPKGTKRATVTIFNSDVATRITRDDSGLEHVAKDASDKRYKMKYGKDGVWTVTVPGDLKGKYYAFNGQTPGVFAKAVGVNGRCGAIIDMADTNPVGWESDVRPPLKSPADLVIYELHHRDFSIARNINLSPEITVKRVASNYPGKFLALTEPWAIGHLKELGVNAVHILPSFDFASIDEARLDEPQYNWGYDPLNYNVPEGSYSTDPADPLCRIREFKQMVQELHRAGIRVILDVVYNHTFDIAGSNFQRTYPDYFFRKKADGTYSDGSGCGNETASEQPLMRRFMIESVKYWATEYHVDGFRFDLMGIHDLETMNQIRAELDKIDPTLFIYGEGWSAGTCAYPEDQLAVKAHVDQLPRIAAFSDELRDALRGPFSDDTKGAFLAGVSGEEESLKFGLAGGVEHPQVDISQVNYTKKHWAKQPTQFISYASCHDDMCLVDRLRASVPAITQDELIRLDLLAQTAVFTSQGVPFMLSGEELLRDKKGVHNSFNSPDSINQLDWSARYKYPQVFSYYKNLIELRKTHPAFRLGDADLVRQHLEFLPTSPCLVAFRLRNHAGGDPWRDIIVVLNANKTPQTVAIPEGNYTVVAAQGEINQQGLGQFSGSSVEVAPQSALIIHD